MEIETQRIEELIARLERAQEGSRELDIQICKVAFGHELARDRETRFSSWPWSTRAPGEMNFCIAPHYTTSLDSAMSLVPEGCGWKVEQTWRSSSDALVGGRHRCEQAATPALALVIAALRARLA